MNALKMINKMSFFPGEPVIPTSSIERKKLISWLINHPIWESDIGFDECVDIDFLPYINPETGYEDSDITKNSAMAIRVEAGA